MAQVDPDEAIQLSEQAWAVWERRKLKLFMLPIAFMIPAAIVAILRKPEEGKTDWMGPAMGIFFLAGLAAFTWVRTKMPISPVRVRTYLKNGVFNQAMLEKLRAQSRE